MQDALKEAVDAGFNTLLEPLSALWSRLVIFLPNLLAAVVILALGYVLSALLRRIIVAVLRRIGLDAATRRIGVRAGLDRAGIQANASEILGGLVFWLLMLTFVVSAAETLGLQNVSRTIDAFVRYLPNVIGASIIAVVGLLIAHFVRDLVRSGTASLGGDYARGLSNLAYGVLVVVIASLAVGQLQINTTLFDRLIEILLIASGGALGLAVGLGTRDIAKQLVAGVYARDLLTHGAQLSIDDAQGVLEEVGAVCMRLKTTDGRTVYVPNGLFTERIVRQGAGVEPGP
jgi:small-conductance mechanosensitive channel